jgi:hypothetical protein
MKTSGKICYLCGELIEQNKGSRDHIPPVCLFPLRIHTSINFITLPSHLTCNNKMSITDEKFRNYLTISIGNNEIGQQQWKDKVLPSFEKKGGSDKKSDLIKNLKQYTKTDNGIVISSPHLLLSKDDPALIPQFNRIVKGLYYNKYKKYLDVNIEIIPQDFKTYFSKYPWKPRWIVIEKNTFQYFIYISTECDKKGVVGMLFYNNLFVLAFFE